jgi:excisionase family DNA binding protein
MGIRRPPRRSQRGTCVVVVRTVRVRDRHGQKWRRIRTIEFVPVNNIAKAVSVRRSLLLSAVIDEVDQALAGLQTARQILSELERSDDSPKPGRVTVPTAPEPEGKRPPSLRYAGATVSEAARTLELSEEHVRRLLRRGELEGINYGGRVGWRVAREYIAELSAQQREARREQESARRAKPPRRP